MPAYSESYWVGHLSMTVAQASVTTDPQPLLKSALKDFLRDRGRDDELAGMLRQTLKVRKP
jgi:hypothetical protein